VAQRYSYRVREEGRRGHTLEKKGTEPTPSNPIIGVNPVMEQANLVRIGKKPIMNYVVACVTLFNSGAEEIMVRARGQAITKAVETVLMLRNSFVKNLEIEEIRIGSEEVTRLDGTRGSISTIEIMLEKG
jgi:DNA-binding protein